MTQIGIQSVQAIDPNLIQGATSVTIEAQHDQPVVITFLPSGKVFHFATGAALQLTKAQWANDLTSFASLLPASLQATISGSIAAVQQAVGAV